MDTIRKRRKTNKKKETENAAHALDLAGQSPQSDVPVLASSQPKLPPAASSDPLTDFKEKLSQEEQPLANVPAKKNFMWPILFVVFLALALLAGIFIYKQGMSKGTQVNVVSLSPTPVVTATPTPILDLSKYPIKILNGSGIEGEASKQKVSLEAEGFKVSSVGNADNSNYTDTVIQAKKDVESGFLDKLKSVLKTSFTVGETQSLSESASTSIVVILGTKK